METREESMKHMIIDPRDSVESRPSEELPESLKGVLTHYYRCPATYERFSVRGVLPPTNGFFLFGKASCYGSYHRQIPSLGSVETPQNALSETSIENGIVYLPFNPAQVIANLGRETYADEWRTGPLSALWNLYYWIRPALPVSIRRHLQKMYLRGWRKLPFPQWPVDCSVDNLEEELMLLTLRASGAKKVPFIWFWPEAHSSCALMTHDIETRAGLEFCETLMDINDSFNIKASFQVIPEDRYEIDPKLLDEIRRRRFEICVHDLNHDGHLYSNRSQFLERAAKINAYGIEMGADGFRAAVLYRKQLWYDSLEFSYDMSVPNVAHLDPQRGGCCTVMPYFLNEILEIPVTTVQDYSLFNILHDYSISLWEQQAAIIMTKHGCMSFIVHPDYMQQTRELSVYKQLLSYLDQLRRESGVWITTPGEVNRWWRQRAAMELVETDRGWRIEGDGKERACVAFASEEDGRLVYSLEKSPRSESPAAARIARTTA
jgi:hypothetical protein